MSRWPLTALLAGLLAISAGAQQKADPQLPPDEDAPAKILKKSGAAPQTNDDLPPDEDASATARVKIGFNPVKSKKDVEVGSFYLKKGDLVGAADRFREATQYNDSNAAAWLMLGETEEKRNSVGKARAAYEKYLQLNPKAKDAAEIRKRLEKLK